MAERSNFRRLALRYHNHLDNMEMQEPHNRAVEHQAPPPYIPYDEDQEPPGYEAHLHDDRDRGHLDYGIHPNREQDCLELDPPQSHGRGRHVYNTAAHGYTNDETHLGDRHDYGFRTHNMGGHRRQLGRVVSGVRVYRCPLEFLAAMDALHLDRNSRHGRYENPYLSPSRGSGLSSQARRGVLPRPDDFNNDLNLDLRGTRGLEREMRGAGVRRRHSFEDDLEDDAMGDAFRAGHRRTNPYRSRYGSRPGYLSEEDYLESDDFEDDFRERGRGPHPHRSGYSFEDEFELIDEDVRTARVRASEYHRRQIRQEADNRAFEMERHRARRGHRLLPGRHFGASLDVDDSEEPRHMSDSEDERMQQCIQRRVLENRHDSVSRYISDSEDERSEQLIRRRMQGHRTRATGIPLGDRPIEERRNQPREQDHRPRPATTHPPSDAPHADIQDLPRNRHPPSPQRAHEPSNKRARPRAIRPPAYRDTCHSEEERNQPAWTGARSGTPTQAPARIRTDFVKRANPAADNPPARVEATVRQTAPASTEYDADGKRQRVGGAGTGRVADVRAAEGRQPASGRDGLVDGGHGSGAEEGGAAGPFSDSSDDRRDTPGTSSDGSDEDGGFL